MKGKFVVLIIVSIFIVLLVSLGVSGRCQTCSKFVNVFVTDADSYNTLKVGDSGEINIKIQDPDNSSNFVDVESNGGLPVNIQDQTTPPLDIFFVQLSGAITSLQENVSIGDSVINVSNVTGNIIVGTYLGLSTSNRFYFGEVVSVSGNLVTLDTPLDFNYSVGNAVIPTTRDLNVDGSVNTQTFFVGTGGPASDFTFDITRIMIKCLTDTAVSLSEFCDQTELTNGLVLRRVDGDTRNIWNVKTNGELGHLCYDYTAYESTNPIQGQDGALFRYTFAGQDKHGVAVRLEAGDELQILVQDDLSDIGLFRIIAEGHIVQD